MEKDFHDKVALVTGGSRGIGRAICEELASRGARVAVNYVSDEVAARSTVDACVEHGPECEAFQADVSSPGETNALLRYVETTLGPVDMLVTSAGIVSNEDHNDLDFETWRKVMRVNVDGTFNSLMAVKDGMIARGDGRIVCIASVAGMRARPKMIPYSTSKAAVIALVRNCAAAFGPQIRVNGVAPGFIETDMTDGTNPDLVKHMREDAFLKRIGQPKDISGTVVHLLSDAAGFISGQTWAVDGGRVTNP